MNDWLAILSIGVNRWNHRRMVTSISSDRHQYPDSIEKNPSKHKGKSVWHDNLVRNYTVTESITSPGVYSNNKRPFNILARATNFNTSLCPSSILPTPQTLTPKIDDRNIHAATSTPSPLNIQTTSSSSVSTVLLTTAPSSLL